MTLHVHKLLHY